MVLPLGLVLLGFLLLGLPACSSENSGKVCPVFDESLLRDRESVTSMDGKVRPEDDEVPPVVNVGYKRFWHEPVLVDVGAVNTSGAEDSAFITPDGNSLFFFFTPYPHTARGLQSQDLVTGIYLSERIGDAWTPAERVFLFPTESLEGCPFFQDDTLYICAIMCGDTGGLLRHYSTLRDGGKWSFPQVDTEGLNSAGSVGELHIHPDGRTIYFHSDREGSLGMRDIWMSERTGDSWGTPRHIEGINSEGNEAFPCLSPDGEELWFSGDSRLWNPRPGSSLFRCRRNPDGSWARPEEIISGFAAEPSIDGEGNIYFIHPYLDENNRLIEMDIYVAYRKK